MLKKLTAAALALLLCLGAGCGKQNTESVPSEPEVVSEVSSVPEPVYYVNPLTGEQDLSLEASRQTPVAIMINNLNLAQRVQTGVGEADIVYETEVEAGITRLMAVYQDIASVGRIGTIRSARYVFVDLALGHDAIYLHHGQDGTYCAPHLKDITHYTVDTNNCGKRISNGLASEHTLYADGSGIYNSFVKGKTANADSWQSFSDGDITLAGGSCLQITVPFSSSYKTSFIYDASTGKYTRQFNGTTLKDYVTGKAEQFKNIFVLKTSIYDYSDGYHRNVSLKGGEGYYFVNGTYTPIKWSKGSSSASFKFTNTDGTALAVNPGNSYVCIANSNVSVGIS